jgi:hypothetical protein
MMRVFAAGTCPIEGAIAPLYFAKVPDSSAIYFTCTQCGVTWTTPPPPNTVDSIDHFRIFFPRGFVIPTREDISRAGLDSLVTDELELSPDDIKQEFDGFLYPLAPIP